MDGEEVELLLEKLSKEQLISFLDYLKILRDTEDNQSPAGVFPPAGHQ